MLLISEGEEDDENSPLSRSPQRQGLGLLADGDGDPLVDGGSDGNMGGTNMGTGVGATVEGVQGTQGSESSSSSRWAKERSQFDKERSQWDRKMKLLTVDNRFLQEEVEKKDGMLGLLTRGLKEVETSQQQVSLLHPYLYLFLLA